jgi:diguanylate cyclase
MPERHDPEARTPTPPQAKGTVQHGALGDLHPRTAAQGAASQLGLQWPARWPAMAVTLGLAGGAVLFAAALAYALALAWRPLTPALVALAAAVGVLTTVLPLAWLLMRTHRSEETNEDEQPTLPSLQGEGERASTLMREPFMELVGREWARSRRYGTGAALLLVEIDRYPRLTAALGSAAGEQVLAALQRRVAQALRGADAVARFEAGQLSVFLAHADSLGALDVAERIRESALKFEVPLAPKRVRFTVSVGVAHLRPAHLQLQALVEDACEAVVAARSAGGNCVRAAPVERSQLPPSVGGPGGLGGLGGAGPRSDHRAKKD